MLIITGSFCHSIPNPIENSGTKKFSCHMLVHHMSKIISVRDGPGGCKESDHIQCNHQLIIVWKRTMETSKGSRLFPFH